MAMLEIKDLEVYYGMIQAIKGISFEVNEGEVIALIGANGAGKTTILHTISGLIAPKKGSITFEGQEITKIPAHKIVENGLAQVPEGRRVFPSLSVLQNLKLGAYTRKDKKEIDDTLKMIYERFPRLEERKNQPAGTLSGGEQQMLAMGRALHGSLPDLRKRDFRYYQTGQRQRNHCSSGRAERKESSVHRRQRLCSGDRQDCKRRKSFGSSK